MRDGCVHAQNPGVVSSIERELLKQDRFRRFIRMAIDLAGQGTKRYHGGLVEAIVVLTTIEVVARTSNYQIYCYGLEHFTNPIRASTDSRETVAGVDAGVSGFLDESYSPTTTFGRGNRDTN